MSTTIAERVEVLEHEMAEVLKKLALPAPQNWMSTFGMFANDPLFDAAMDSGDAWRKEQTWEKERPVDAGS